MAKHLRLKKLINWTVQGPIVIRLMIHFMAYNTATLLLLLVVYGVKSSLAVIADSPVSADPATFWQQASPVVICMLVMMPFMVWDLMKLTNRIAGPLCRFESLLKEFGKTGKLKLAVLRQGDLLTDYQTQFNEFVAAMHAKYPELRPGNASPAPESPLQDGSNEAVAFRKTV
jgi:hypothetical protein